MLSLSVLMLVVPQVQVGGLPGAQPCPRNPPLGTHSFTVPATGLPETYTIWGPTNPPNRRPLVVLFHSSYRDHAEPNDPTLWDCYDFITQAADYGWFVVMHDGAPGCTIHATYGNEDFQRHTEAVIEQVMCSYPIKRGQVYGYGFSMGGEEVLAYAARHRDPTSSQGFFAAVINHSGYISPPAEKAMSNCSTLPVCVYGAKYCDDTFAWRRGTVLDVEGISGGGGAPCTYTGTLPLTIDHVSHWNSQIHNIARLAIQTFHAQNEQMTTCMVEENQLLRDWLGDRYQVPDIIHEFDCVTADPLCNVPITPTPFNQPDCDFDSCSEPHMGVSRHQWDAVCAGRVIDFLEDHTRATHLAGVPNGVILVAEDDKRYYHFAVQRTQPGDFGRLAWFKPHSNAIGFLNSTNTYGSEPRNIDRIRVFTDTFTPWKTKLADGLPYFELRPNYAVDFVIDGYACSPAGVFIDGNINNPHPFTWDPATETVEFSAAAGVDYVIQPGC